MDLIPMQSKPKGRNNMKSSQLGSTSYCRKNLHKGISSRIGCKYDKVIEDGPNSNRLLYRSMNSHILSDNKSINSSSDYVDGNNLKTEMRLMSGYHDSCIINIMPQIDCKMKTIDDDKPPENIIMPNVIHIQLSESHTDPFLQRHVKCLYISERKRPQKITRGTQTIYRESSMQTLPYLPDVSNDKAALKELELFKLSKLLKGEGPPGLWEVEILERARKRWALEKSLNEKFQCAMKKAREDIGRKRKMPQHKAILEAFEWEDWLEREERIQGCQMLRFQLVLQIFEKRQREMHKISDIRIEKCCEQIIQKRDQELKKNEIEFGRDMRRLKIKHEKKPRNWRKEKISNQLGDPSSEYYAPQMRYGVNPNRRHFQLSRKAFEMRMEDLEKRAVNMKNLECPFAKLKEWSKPKEQKAEVEQNFCTETNLQKLYEGLKDLREQSKKQKIIPKCLIEKTRKSVIHEQLVSEEFIIEELDMGEEDNSSNSVEMYEEEVQAGSSYSQDSLLEMCSQRNNQRFTVAEMLEERRNEELENMLAEYEGKGIGWLLRFLSEERSRLQEQRKLHFVTMLAQKERWRREAGEAGLRQKENEMRKIYEEVFDETEKANTEVCEQYLDNIFGIDTQEQADFDAIMNITDLARTIDIDLQRWLTSFRPIQNPLNYDDLRCLLRDLVFPDNIAECLSQKYETKSIIDYIINDVLLEQIYERLEPIEIARTITNSFVDRLIDNDLYVLSTECSSGCDCQNECSCQPHEMETKAILRKLVRYSVPGRRWRTPTERIADENVNDIVEGICGAAGTATRCRFKPGASKNRRSVKKTRSKIDLLSASHANVSGKSDDMFETSSGTSTTDQITVISYNKARKRSDSKKMSLIGVENNTRSSSTAQVTSINDLCESFETAFRPGSLKKAVSTYDMTTHVDDPRRSIYSSSDYDDEKLQRSSYRHSTKIKEMEKISESFLANIINEVVKSIVPTIEGEVDSDADRTSSGKKLSTAKSQITLKPIPTDLSDDNNSSQTETETDVEDEEKDSSLTHSSDEPCEEELISKVSEYKMVMYEGELKKILCSEEDECKCQQELDHRNFIRQLYEKGKITVIYKDRTTEEKEDITLENETDQTEKEVNLAELTFEYATSMDDKSFAVYHDEGMYEAVEDEKIMGDENLTVLEHEIEDNDDKQKEIDDTAVVEAAETETDATQAAGTEEQPAVPAEESPATAAVAETGEQAAAIEESPVTAPAAETEEQPAIDTTEAAAIEESPAAAPIAEAEEQTEVGTTEAVAAEESLEVAAVAETEEQPAVDETAKESP